jgi:hypothetical protein
MPCLFKKAVPVVPPQLEPPKSGLWRKKPHWFQTGYPVPTVQGRKALRPKVRVNGEFEAVFSSRVYQAIETRLWDSSIEPIPAGRDARPADQTRRDFPASPRCFGYVSRMAFSAKHWQNSTYENN